MRLKLLDGLLWVSWLVIMVVLVFVTFANGVSSSADLRGDFDDFVSLLSVCYRCIVLRAFVCVFMWLCGLSWE